MTVNARTITDEEFFYGHKACPGCGGALAVRQALKVHGNTISQQTLWFAFRPPYPHVSRM